MSGIMQWISLLDDILRKEENHAQELYLNAPDMAGDCAWERGYRDGLKKARECLADVGKKLREDHTSRAINVMRKKLWGGGK